MILKLFRSSTPAAKIGDLYGAIVAQARKPAFYMQPGMELGMGADAGYGVPDTLEGRFDLIVLHLVLVLLQIGDRAGPTPPAGKTEGQARASRTLGQGLFDAFCRDLDDNLREMGVGDLTVPKKMRGFAEAFYGRQAAYAAALAAHDRRELENALARNIFDEMKAGAGPARLAAYARAVLLQFEAQGQDAFEAALWRGALVFPSPGAVPAPNQEAFQQEAIQNG
jgi:cytochrome b pre-mRNA-processing protein 3